MRARLNRLEDRRVGPALGLIALSVLVAVPYAIDGPGFFLDDWGDLARIQARGWLAQEGWGKLASRPGAWFINTVLYATLGRHLILWLVVLTAIAAATAVALMVVLGRFVPAPTAFGIAALWVLLPDHTSLRLFANCAPIAASLLFLLVGINLLAGRWYLLGAGCLCAGAFCYEAVLIPGLAAVIVLHLWRRWGTTVQVRIAVVALIVTGVLMSIHPTYDPLTTSRGTPRYLLPAHFAGGLTQNPTVAVILAVTAALGVGLAVIVGRGEIGRLGSGPWFVVLGAGVMVCGLAAFVLKFPTDERGVADRNYVVSSVGAALIWWGIGQFVLVRWKPVLALATAAFVVVLGLADMRFDHDWSLAAHDTTALVHQIDHTYDGHPPPRLVVGPGMPHWAGIGAINTFFAPDASQVLTGHRMAFRVDSGGVLWTTVPPRDRFNWTRVSRPAQNRPLIGG